MHPNARKDVDREAVKTLAIAVGVREAARQVGIPEATVQAWSARDKWFQSIETAKAIAEQRKERQPLATKPGQAMLNVMNGRKEKSRFLLSKFVLNASQVASRSRKPLQDAQNVRHVAAVHSAIWPEEQKAAGVSLSILNVAGGMG